MKKQLLFGAAAALLLTACSNDDVVEIQQDGIQYAVTANTITRAADSYCNTNLPGSFKVWAMTNDNPSQLYIDGDVIARQNGAWIDQNGVRYWPNGKTLDFYAEVNGDKEFNLNGGAPYFKDFKVNPTVTSQLDLMYAVAKAAGRNTNQNKVALNFRHALSQVCFMARNDAKTLEVVVKGVSVGHLSDQGSFTFPTTATDQNYQHPSHGDTPDPNAPALNGGTWTNLDAADNQYDVTGLNVTLAPQSAVANLTAPQDQHQNGFANVMTLMPQKQTAWNPEQKGADYNGAYFMLDVQILNISGDVKTPVYTGQCVIPATIEWNQGYRYIYTLIFDEGGNGGYTPTPDDPQPVLASIKYDVTVDDFIPVNGDDHMNGDGKDPVVTNEWKVNAYDGDTFLGSQTVRSAQDEVYYSFAGLQAPAKEGWIFKGWSTTRGGEVAEGMTLVKGQAEVNVYAVYEEAPKPKHTYRIHFVSGLEGATNMPEDVEVTTTDLSYSYTLPSYENAPKSGQANLNCHGWSLSAKNQNLDYANGATVTLTPSNSEITLYVVWKAGDPSGSGSDLPGIDPTDPNNRK